MRRQNSNPSAGVKKKRRARAVTFNVSIRACRNCDRRMTDVYRHVRPSPILQPNSAARKTLHHFPFAGNNRLNAVWQVDGP